MHDQPEAVSLNVDDLDISELEQRLEMTVTPLTPGGCVIHYGHQT